MKLPLPDGARSALLIVDMQEFFFRMPERRHYLDEVVTNINHLIRHFEQQGEPVVHAVTAYAADGSDWDLKIRAAGTPEHSR
jgi:isochorismate hydrolase